MNGSFKYILLIISFLSFGELFSQSLITAKFHQTDTICEGTSGRMRLYMYNSTQDQKVAVLRLYFNYDHLDMKIDDITSEQDFLTTNMTITYPEPGFCCILDTLTTPNNFYNAAQIENQNIGFNIKFEGLKEGVTSIAFVEDSCYFRTEEEEPILAFYHRSPDIRVHPGYIRIAMEQTGIGCSYENKGRVVAQVLDGVGDYEYKWSSGKSFANLPMEVGELEGGELTLTVKDGNGCLHDTTMTVDVLPAPKIAWDYEPQPAVIEHPIKFFATEFVDASNWFWKFLSPDKDSIDLKENARKQEFNWIFYEDGDYEISLTATGINGCDTTVTETINVLPPQLEFKNLVTPNGNKFRILLQDQSDVTLDQIFVSHQVLIYDRNGRKVYDTNNFSHDGWDGKGCPNGSYIFVLKGRSTRKEYIYRGSLVILGG